MNKTIVLETENLPVSKFSLGMRQRLAIARAIIHKPKLLILDEPINGLDPMGIREMRNLFIDLVKKQGITLLLSSHILTEIELIVANTTSSWTIMYTFIILIVLISGFFPLIMIKKIENMEIE